MDLASVKNAADLGELLKIVRSRADLRYRDFEQASRHSFYLSKATVGATLGGKFPRKEFLATFLDVCGVPPDQRKDWLATWERLAPTCTTSGRKTRVAQVVDEADQLERHARARADTILRDAQQRAERLEQDARTRADTVLRDAHGRTERLEEETRTRTDSVLRDAQERAERLEQDAQARATVIVFEAEERAARITRDGQARATQTIYDGDEHAARTMHEAKVRAAQIVHEAEGHIAEAEQRVTHAEERASQLLQNARAQAEKLAKTVAVDRVAAMAKQILVNVRAKANKDRDQRIKAANEAIDKALHLAKLQAQQIRADAHASAQEIETRVRAWAESQIKDTHAITEQMIAKTQAKLAAREEAIALEYTYTWMRADAINALAYAHRRRYRPWKWRQFTKLAEATTQAMLTEVMRKIAADPDSPLAQIARHSLAEIEAPLPPPPPGKKQYPYSYPVRRHWLDPE